MDGSEVELQQELQVAQTWIKADCGGDWISSCRQAGRLLPSLISSEIRDNRSKVTGSQSDEVTGSEAGILK